MSFRIAVDAMGSDAAPAPEVAGTIAAAREWTSLRFVLVGDEQRIRAEAQKAGGLPSNVEVMHTTEVITPDEEPTKAVRAKKDASLTVAARLVKEGQADALLSAGSTGALVVVGTLGIGRMKGIDRPALGTIMPTVEQPVFMLDVGATPDARPEWLVQFALMGDIYARQIMGLARPRVALLSNGTEAEKGNALVKATYPLLQELESVHFIGNIEARDVPFGGADVVVADGFPGNVLLKTYEGVAMALFKAMKQALTSSPITSIGAALAKPGLKQMAKRFDYTEYGGALLLGLKAPVVKCHGSSNAHAIRSGIRVMKLALEGDVIGRLADAVAKLPAQKPKDKGDSPG
ncbi:phosphate acyltransferase PlsX [Symbiobacterium terraclitae]|uniref:phosphate acyltransferase PlsX n=1 Tax=Symbiobacterium terraclitae TaxID=557451 RepID=UPI0035B522F9